MPLLSQLNESQCEALTDTADEVSLKLGLWEGSAELEELSEGWRAQHFEALDVPAMDETIGRCARMQS